MCQKQELTESQKAKYKKGICVTPFCMKRALTKRGKNGRREKKRRICATCERKLQKERHPIKYAYQVLKNNAKRRNKIFTLSFDKFERLVKKNDYMRKRGRGSKSLQVDRDKEELGYTDENVNIITLRENVYKYAKYRRDNSEVPF